MFGKMPLFQAIFVDSFDDFPEKRAEPLSDKSKFLIEGVLQDVLVYVTHKVDQTLLLLARHSFISTIEIAHQHAVEPRQDIV